MQPQSRTSLDTSELIHSLSLGQFMNVEILNIHKDRFNTTLIGLKPQKFLLLELPNIVKRGELLDRMLMNNNLMVRTICELTTGECLAFETAVDAIVKSPHPLVYLNYPLQLVFHQLRKENRKHLFITASLLNKAQGVQAQGTIVDISTGGCRLELDHDEIVDNQEDNQLQIRFTEPGSGSEVTRQVRLCSRHKKGSSGVYLGLAFDT